MFHSIDSLLLAVPNLETASQAYDRLGLRLCPGSVGRRFFSVGPGDNRVSVELIGAIDASLAEFQQRAVKDGRSLFALGLRVTDREPLIGRLTDLGVQISRIGQADWLPLHDLAGADLLIRTSEAAQVGQPNHILPLKRLDHLAVVTHDLDQKSRFWEEMLGVPVSGEITTPTMVIRQLRIGDAVLELLGPTSSDSPIWKRTPGLISMASWEVADLDAVVRQVRAAGFTVSDPAIGPLPGTRIATVPGAELAGVNMQLLEYVAM